MTNDRSSMTSRRGFLKAASLATAVMGAETGGLLAQGTRQAKENSGIPKRVIFLVSDGMNHGALSLAQHYLGLFEDRQSHWMRMYRELPVVRSLVETFSANSVVTDSAAASSAWGGGRRVNNGTLNVTPDGKEPAPMQSILKRISIPTGLVSTASITHATPAGFAANMRNRSDEEAIARQYLERSIPVLLGGGRKYFPEEVRKSFQKAGYQILDSRQDLLDASAEANQPVLGTFSTGYMPYTIDRESDPKLKQGKPSLKEMAEFAVKRLDATARDQWFLMVEGARIDHCGHANDAAASIHEQIDFDEALGAMIGYASERRDTLVIVTTDHGCGGIQMNGRSALPEQQMAPGIYNGSTPAFRQIAGFRHSFEWLGHMGKGLSGPPLRDFLKEHTGLSLGKEDLKRAQGLKGEDLSRLFAARHGITWTSSAHTADLVELCAYGPGSHRFPAFAKNYEVHDLLLQAMSVG